MCTCNIHAQVHPHTQTHVHVRESNTSVRSFEREIDIFFFIIILFRFYETASDQITGRGVYLARVSSLASEQAMSSCTRRLRQRRRRRRLYNMHEDRCKPFISHPRGSSSTVPKCVYYIYVINPV